MNTVELDAIMKTDLYRAAYNHSHEMISAVLPLNNSLIVIKQMLLVPVHNEHIAKSLFLIAFKQAYIDLTDNISCEWVRFNGELVDFDLQ